MGQTRADHSALWGRPLQTIAIYGADPCRPQRSVGQTPADHSALWGRPLQTIVLYGADHSSLWGRPVSHAHCAVGKLLNSVSHSGASPPPLLWVGLLSKLSHPPPPPPPPLPQPILLCKDKMDYRQTLFVNLVCTRYRTDGPLPIS